MTATDNGLVARVRGRTPADPAVRDCWDAIVFGVVLDGLTAADLADVLAELTAGRDVHRGDLAISHAGGILEVVHGRPASCPAAAMAAELARLLAPLPDAAALAATAVDWTHSGEPDLPYRATLGERCLLLRPAGPGYTLIADGVTVADLGAWPPAWRRPAPASAHGIGPARLRVWAELLCRDGGTPAEVAAALGIPAVARPNDFGCLVADPPPPGTSRLELSPRGGRLQSITVTYAAGAPTRADLDTYLGHGGWLPRVHWDSPHRIAYRVEVAGAPSTCTVFPGFDDEPADGSVALDVTLRRDRP
ncbi:MAG: hypothetical protein V7637_4716 [Mycobacteriales bacterium]